MENNSKLNEWAEMDFSEKQKYNGFNGFCDGRLFSEDNRFMIESKEKLEKRRVKEQKARKLKKEVKNG